MKKLIFLAIAIAIAFASQAQTEQRMVRVHNGGNVVFQLPTAQMDSVKSHDRMATFYYGDGSWSRNIHQIDSMTFAMVPASDTTTIIDTTAIDTASSIRIHWGADSVTVVNPYASNGLAITVDGFNVSANDGTSIANLVYELSGASSNGFFYLKPNNAYILRLNGVSLTSEGKPAVNIDKNKAGVVHLVDGTVNTFQDGTANDGKSCFYSKGALTIQGGGALHVTSNVVNGLQGKQGVTILNGDITVAVSANTAKGIKTDGNVVIQGGNLAVSASGTMEATYIDSLQVWDKSYSSCIKSDGNYIQHGGNVTLTLPASNAGGKCISTDLDVEVHGGYLTMSTAGAGAILGTGTGSNAEDGYVNACIKADRHVILDGGNISAVSTGKGGRGICADSNLYVGKLGDDNDLLHIFVQTSGATVNGGSSGGWGGPGGWGGGNTGDDDYFKGIAKGIRIEGNIYINSGHLQSYCSQTSGDPTGEAIESKDTIFINGGDIEANAYDDAINAANYIEVNGGRVWAYSRGNDGVDCNGNLTINGGLVLVKGNEVGIDSDTEHGNLFRINGGTVITAGGSMGAWDTPHSSSTQRWVSITSASTGNNGILLMNQAGDTLVVYKNNSFTGSGFLNGSKGMGDTDFGTGTKPPGGGGSGSGTVVISCPGMTQGASYQVYKSATITGGSSWHGYYTGASAQGTGTMSTINAQ